MQRTQVEFPTKEASYYPMQTAIKFPAVVDGRQVHCFLEIVALAENFDDFEAGHGMEAFRSHRSEIESIVSTMIENGYVNSDGDLFIRNRDFAIFKENVRNKRGGD